MRRTLQTATAVVAAVALSFGLVGACLCPMGTDNQPVDQALTAPQHACCPSEEGSVSLSAGCCTRYTPRSAVAEVAGSAPALSPGRAVEGLTRWEAKADLVAAAGSPLPLSRSAPPILRI